MYDREWNWKTSAIIAGWGTILSHCAFVGSKPTGRTILRRVDREAEGTFLLRRQVVKKLLRGFESLTLHQNTPNSQRLL